MRKIPLSATALIVALSLASPAFAGGYDPTSGGLRGNAERAYDPTGGVQAAQTYVGRPYDPTDSVVKDGEAVARRGYDPTFVEQTADALISQSQR